MLGNSKAAGVPCALLAAVIVINALLSRALPTWLLFLCLRLGRAPGIRSATVFLFGACMVSLGAREPTPDVFYCAASLYSEAYKMHSSPFCSGF